MSLSSRLLAAGRALFQVEAPPVPAPAQPATGRYGLALADLVIPEQPSGVIYLVPGATVSREWTVRDLRAAQQAADSGNLSRIADICESLILGDDRAPTVLNTRVNGLLGSDLTFEAGFGRKKNQAIRALEAGEDWWTSFPTERLGQLILWG